MKTRGGRSVINARRAKGRARLSVWFLVNYRGNVVCPAALITQDISILRREVNILLFSREKAARQQAA